MKLTLFQVKGSENLRIAALMEGPFLVDLSAALADSTGEHCVSMRRFLELGPTAFTTASASLKNSKYHVPLDTVVLKAPIYDSEKVLCVGMNYVDHCLEQGMPIPKEPVIFSKFASAVIASGEPIVKPKEVRPVLFLSGTVLLHGYRTVHACRLRNLTLKWSLPSSLARLGAASNQKMQWSMLLVSVVQLFLFIFLVLCYSVFSNFNIKCSVSA
jgi:hypothetical protein